MMRLICREPYRLFFPLGVLFGMAGVGHWLLYSTGLTQSYSGYYHAAIQIWLTMGCFVCGFLMTAIPRFADAPHAKPIEIASILLLDALIFIFLMKGKFVTAGVIYAAWLVNLLGFVLRRFLKKGSQVNPPLQFLWIPVAFLHGLCGILLVVLAQSGAWPADFLEIGRSMGEQGFLLCLVVGVGGFLGPRLLGEHELPNPEKIRKAPSIRKQRIWIHGLCAALLFSTFWLEGVHEAFPSYFLRAALVTFVLAYNKVLVGRPKISGFFHRLLSFSFWFVVLGLWAAALFPKHHIAMLHLLFIGGFGLITLLIASMVVLSHGGHGDQMGKTLPIFVVVAVGLASSFLVRLSAQFSPTYFFLLLGVSSTLWILTGFAWLVFFTPFLLKVPGVKPEGADHAC